jgi:DNA-binding transcriptional LysR family regulator
MTEPLLLVLPRTHPAGERVPLAALADAPWIAGVAGTQFAPVVERTCHAAGFAPRVVHRADEAFLLQALVAAGLGVALLPALACVESAGVRFAEATPAPPRRHVFALARRGAERRPAVRAIVDALLRRARPA